MASDAGPLATDSPSSTRAVPAPPVGAISSIATDDPARLLKRQREATPPSPHSLVSQSLSALGSPAKSARLALATGASPPPLTGAAALEDERRRKEAEAASSPPASSDNPSHRVLESLLAGGAMSRPSDAPQVPIATMDAPSKSAPALHIPSDASDRFGQDDDETSPHSVNSIAGAGVTASPTPMDIDGKTDGGMSQVAGEERSQPNSLSYPGSLQASAQMVEAGGPRVMSFPVPGLASPSSTGNKKHKCPYCNTEFTRHHNLKSHLLTHSQEKPYVCTECPLRFRRLHDLKRHGKLHTGEKPHICPKCDRKFARGDALARHSKGAGGCAGRRSSMGSFADGDEIDGNTLGEGDESAMAGLYEHGEEDELRRQSMPNASTQQVGGSESDYAAHARTYPPAQRPQGSGLYPPNVNPSHSNSAGSSSVQNSNGGGHTPNTSVSSAQAASAGLYSQAGMTESPKPLSPAVVGQDPNRQRSPGLSQQLQQQQLGRRQSDQPKAPGLSHPGYTAAGTGGVSHGRTPSGTNSDSRNMFAQSDPGVWAYVNALEERVTMLTNKVSALDQEVTALKEQRATAEGEASVSS